MAILVSGSYAAWNWKRLTQYDAYHVPGNAQGFGYSRDLKGHHKGLSSHSRMLSDDMDWDADLELGNNVEIVHSSSNPAAGGVMAASPTRTSHDDTAYNPVATTDETITVPKRPASYVSVTGAYNHTRDTSFDEYVRQQQKGKGRRVSQRMSIGTTTTATASSPPPPARSSSSALYRLSLNLKNEVDDALSSVFWGGAGSSAASSRKSMDTSTSTPQVMSGGTVAGVKSVRDSLGRAPSDGSEKGALGSVVEDEEVEEEEEEGRRQRNVDEAARALLGEQNDEQEDRLHPALLRPGTGNRPKSEVIQLVVTPASPSNPRMTWGSAYSRD